MRALRRKSRFTKSFMMFHTQSPVYRGKLWQDRRFEDMISPKEAFFVLSGTEITSVHLRSVFIYEPMGEMWRIPEDDPQYRLNCEETGYILPKYSIGRSLWDQMMAHYEQEVRYYE